MSSYGIDLNDSWTISITDSRNVPGAIEPCTVTTVSTISEFWSFVRNISFLLDRLPTYGIVRMIRATAQIQPNGPEVVFSLPSCNLSDIKTIWSNCCALLVGESLLVADLIVGASIEHADNEFILHLFHDAAMTDTQCHLVAERMLLVVRSSLAGAAEVSLAAASSAGGGGLEGSVRARRTLGGAIEPLMLSSSSAQADVRTDVDSSAPRLDTVGGCPVLRYELDYLIGLAPHTWRDSSDLSALAGFAGRTTVESAIFSLTSPSGLPDLSRLNISDSSTSSLLLSSLGLTSPSSLFASPSTTGAGGIGGSDEEAAGAATAAMVASDVIDSSSSSSASISASDLNSQLVDFQIALQPYLEHFSVGLYQNCPPQAQDDLLAEGCPKCLQTSDVLPSGSNSTGSASPIPCVVMRCQQLECQHVIHANCLMNNSSYMPTLHRYHSTNFFRAVPVLDPSEVDPVSARDTMGSRRCTLELEFSHMLSNAQILRIDWPYLNNSFLDSRSGKDYLLCSLDPEKHKVFFSIERARIIFKCIDSATHETFQHDANYNIHKVNSRYIKLILVDSQTRNSLLIGIRRKDAQSSFYVSCVKYEFGSMPSQLTTPIGVGAQSMPVATASLASAVSSSFGPMSSLGSGSVSSLMAAAVTRPAFTPASAAPSMRPSVGGMGSGVVSGAAGMAGFGGFSSSQYYGSKQASTSGLRPLYGQQQQSSMMSRSAFGSSSAPFQQPIMRVPGSNFPEEPFSDDEDEPEEFGPRSYNRPPSPDTYDGAFRRAEHDQMNPANMTGPMVTGIPEIDNHIGASGPNSPAIIDHVVGRVYMLSKSQGGSRFVQQKLDEADPTYFAIFFDEMRPHMAELMMDSFAHYAVEKLIRNCTVAQRIELLQALSLDITTVACHKQGSFSIQSLMDTLQSDEEIAALGHSLDKDMVRLITNSSGHFVILRFLQHFPQSQHIGFILDAIQNSCLEIATDHHGLRVLKTVVDVAPASELHGVYKAVARLTMKLAENQYGNYCIQHVLDHAPPNVCANIKMKMEGKYVRLAKQKFSSNVVEKCLRTSNQEWRAVIIRELVSSIGELIRDRYGNYVLQTAISLCDAHQVADFARAVSPHMQQLRENVRSKWAKIIKTATQRAQQQLGGVAGGNIGGFGISVGGMGGMSSMQTQQQPILQQHMYSAPSASMSSGSASSMSMYAPHAPNHYQQPSYFHLPQQSPQPFQPQQHPQQGAVLGFGPSSASVSSSFVSQSSATQSMVSQYGSGLFAQTHQQQQQLPAQSQFHQPRIGGLSAPGANAFNPGANFYGNRR